MHAKRAFLEKLAFICLISGIQSCGNTNDSSTPDDDPDSISETLDASGWSQLDLTWSVHINVPTSCSAPRRIVVDHEGRYAVQACGSSSARLGRLSPQDREQLTRIANRVAESHLARSQCEPVPYPSEKGILKMKFNDDRRRTLYTSSIEQGNECYWGERVEIEVLVEYLETLADWYGSPRGPG